MTKKKKKLGKVGSNLTKVVKQFIQGKSYKPQPLGELRRALGLPQQHEATLRGVLDHLIEEGDVDIVGKKYVASHRQADILTGVLRVHPRGFGFLQPDEASPYLQDIFIPKHLTQHAVDGDLVEVMVNPDSFSEKGPEGRVITILKRSRTHITGIIKHISRTEEIIAYVPLLGTRKRVIVETASDQEVQVGDRVIMEVLDWGSEASETTAKLSHHLGHISDPSCDIDAAIEEYELKDQFPSPVINAAKKYGTQVSQSEIKIREDLRDLECVTIDPNTAKDFDDALSLTKDSKGVYHLGVHIADVSHYVTMDSVLDKEASKRCNSTYFPNRCIPMLPYELSESLCSLKPNVNRLAATVFMDFDQNGTLIDYRITRSVIKSKKRFTYEQAKQVLDGELKSPHAKLLKLMTELCALLKKKRHDRGSIEFALPELVVVVDKDGAPYATDFVEYDITHRMVEEFMLKANETVAQHLCHMGKDITYRIHEEPSDDNMREFASLARTFGFQLPDEPTPDDLQQMFDRALDSPFGAYLSTGFIRRMRLASYSPKNIGHYGLALTHYCHFTSPIRRYVDLVIHRILFGEDHDLIHLENVALRSSEQERISSRAENSVNLLKKLRLLQGLDKVQPHYQFEAVVTQVKPFGFFFEVLDLMLEGFMHISEIEDDYYIYDESRSRLRGRATGTTYSPGTPVTVMLKDIDLILLQTQWDIVTTSGVRSRKKRRRKK